MQVHGLECEGVQIMVLGRVVPRRRYERAATTPPLSQCATCAFLKRDAAYRTGCSAQCPVQ